MTRYALFDFDSTLTDRDTTKYLLGEILRVRPLKVIHVFPLLVAKAFGSSAALQYAKNYCIGSCIRGLSSHALARVTSRFVARVQPFVRTEVLARAREICIQGTQVVVVTASPQFVLESWCNSEGFHCIGTRYETGSQGFTGRLSGSPCYGRNKIDHLEMYGISETSDVAEAWSDSLSDLPMMMLADCRYWICSHADFAEIGKADPEGRHVDAGT